MIRLRQIAVVLALSLALVVSSAPAQAQTRLVAVGDIHGDFDAFVGILQQAGLIDSKLHWSGKNATLVQTGDMLDRGPKSREVMDLLMSLETEAPRSGGRVVTLLGNHEAMNIMGDLRYATPMFANFADKSSEKRRKAAYEAFVAWQKARAAAGRKDSAQLTADSESAWMTAHPLGFVEQREAMSPTGTYGQWLRERPALVKIGTTLFVHGGISPELAGWKPDAIQARVHTELQAFDALKDKLLEHKIILPTFNFEECLAAAQVELDILNEELARKTAEAAKKSKGPLPANAFDAEKKHLHNISTFLGLGGWLSVHPTGPLWFRGYATWTDAEGAPQLAKILEGLGVSQIVVGHTPQKDGRITARFDGKVMLIDTGMLSSYFPGGRSSALEIAAGKITAIYPDQRVVLLDAASVIAPTVPASPDEQSSGEIPGGGLAEQQQNPPAQPPAAASAGKATAPPIVWYDADGKPLPFQSVAEIEDFLRKAKVVKVKDIAIGVTHPRKVLLEKDGVRANAKFSSVSIEKQHAELASGKSEFGFRDDAIFDLAAQEIGLMLGMDNLPPVVQRTINGEKGIIQIWVENTMTEGERKKSNISPPNALPWNHQVQTMRFFDNLIANVDRNAGNILIDKDWRIWLIDHTRAFRRNDKPENPESLLEIDRGIWTKLQAMDEKAVKDRLKPYLRSDEINAVLKRRLKIIEIYSAEIAKRGEREVVKDFDW